MNGNSTKASRIDQTNIGNHARGMEDWPKSDDENFKRTSSQEQSNWSEPGTDLDLNPSAAHMSAAWGVLLASNAVSTSAVVKFTRSSLRELLLQEQIIARKECSVS